MNMFKSARTPIGVGDPLGDGDPRVFGDPRGVPRGDGAGKK